MNPIVDKIRKTLALANGAGASEQERETALRMAHALLAKHNLTLADVGDAPQAKAADGSDRVREDLVTTGRPWSRSVCHSIANLMFCEYVYIQRPGERDAKHCFIGRFENAQTATVLADYVLRSIARESRQHDSPRSFCNGAAIGLREQVEKLKATPEASTGTSLVPLYNSETATNQLALRRMFPQVKAKTTALRNRDSDSWGAGVQKGRTIPLNRQVR